MSELHNRIRKPSLHAKIMTAEETIPFFKNGMDLGFSGFSVGNPKAVPLALADHVESQNLQGKLSFNIFTGASIGLDVENRWAMLDMIDTRWPYQSADISRKQVNAGNIRMGDKHLSMFAQDLAYGFQTIENNGRLDLAVIEASAITEDGGIVPTGAVGICPELIITADKIIVEICTATPSFEGLHDIVMPTKPPFKQPYQIIRVDDRIGTTAIPCDPDKIVAIVESRQRDGGRPLADPSADEEIISRHILDFLTSEVKAGRLPKNLLPLQSGVGSIANAVLHGLTHGPFDSLQVWTEVMHDTILDLHDNGKLVFASATSFALSPSGIDRLYDNFDAYTSRVILRPSRISNHPEIIRRLGVIAMNTPVEFDIYAHANSSHINGSAMVNGIGGSGDFLRNAYLSIMHSPSTRPTASDPTGISCVVPKVSHVDHTEHDLDVLVTEQGLADLRGLTPRDRAKQIIERCAHPDYRPLLHDYLDRAARECLSRGAAHQPHMLSKVFKMHDNLLKAGTMKIDNWD